MLSMKTTIDISDPLLREAWKVAAREGTTLRALVEQGLRKVVAEKRRPVFRLRKASFGGHGLRPELREAGWERLRDLAYESRGE
jgi:Bacterial antitoxin of type II TA system, VapB